MRFHAIGLLAVRLCVAAILILAAVLKHLSPIPAMSGFAGVYSPQTAHYLVVAIIAVELILGLWLLSGIATKLSWGITVVLFAGFICIALGKALMGSKTCGCFGAVPMSPWAMFALDLGVLLALFVWNPFRIQPARAIVDSAVVNAVDWRRPAWKYAAFFAAALVSTIYLFVSGWQVHTDAGQIAADQLVILSPAEWDGKRLPILDQIDIRDQLVSGTWLVVFVHSGCPRCKEVIQECQVLAEGLANKGATRIAIVELPPYGHGTPPPSDGGIVSGKLNEKREWFLETPTILRLDAAQVVGFGPQELEATWSEATSLAESG